MVSSTCHGKTHFIRKHGGVAKRGHYLKHDLFDADRLRRINYRLVRGKNNWRYKYWMKYNWPNAILFINFDEVDLNPSAAHLFVCVPLEQLLDNIENRAAQLPADHPYNNKDKILKLDKQYRAWLEEHNIKPHTSFEEAINDYNRSR